DRHPPEYVTRIRSPVEEHRHHVDNGIAEPGPGRHTVRRHGVRVREAHALPARGRTDARDVALRPAGAPEEEHRRGTADIDDDVEPRGARAAMAAAPDVETEVGERNPLGPLDLRSRGGNNGRR